jgi:REP element-mobilizing transposase RayT
VLECTTSKSELITMVSLQPQETISACVGKLKGRVSKWLNEKLGSTEPLQLLSRGYFACTVGKSRREAVEEYLAKQAQHHNYDKRQLPPIFVEHYDLSASDEARLTVQHACVVSLFHIVLATWKRRGVFGSQEGRAIAAELRRRQEQMRIAIIKVSFVPDHVHLAIRLHPTVSPAEVVAALMNAAQDTVQDLLVREGLECLWERSAYVGSYGDLASPQIRKYIRSLFEDD